MKPSGIVKAEIKDGRLELTDSFGYVWSGVFKDITITDLHKGAFDFPDAAITLELVQAKVDAKLSKYRSPLQQRSEEYMKVGEAIFGFNHNGNDGKVLLNPSSTPEASDDFVDQIKKRTDDALRSCGISPEELSNPNPNVVQLPPGYSIDSLNVGREKKSEGSSIGYYGQTPKIDLPFEFVLDSEKPAPPKHKCYCTKDQVNHRGCRCGGV